MDKICGKNPITSPSPKYQCCLHSLKYFNPENLTENSNVDIGRGMSKPKI